MKPQGRASNLIKYVLLCSSIQKKELENLEQELQGRVASVAAHRVKVERLQQELALLAAKERGLTRALADGGKHGGMCTYRHATLRTQTQINRNKNRQTLHTHQPSVGYGFWFAGHPSIGSEPCVRSSGKIPKTLRPQNNLLFQSNICHVRGLDQLSLADDT